MSAGAGPVCRLALGRPPHDPHPAPKRSAVAALLRTAGAIAPTVRQDPRGRGPFWSTMGVRGASNHPLPAKYRAARHSRPRARSTRKPSYDSLNDEPRSAGARTTRTLKNDRPGQRFRAMWLRLPEPQPPHCVRTPAPGAAFERCGCCWTRTTRTRSPPQPKMPGRSPVKACSPAERGHDGLDVVSARPAPAQAAPRPPSGTPAECHARGRLSEPLYECPTTRLTFR